MMARPRRHGWGITQGMGCMNDGSLAMAVAEALQAPVATSVRARG